MIFSKEQLADFSFSGHLEWLETNGLGGYASGTLAGSNSRRYHGLLVAATKPPVGRMVVLSKLEETIVTKTDRFDLSTNQYPGAVHPAGFRFLKSFERNIFPEFVYEADGVELKKTIAAIQGENTTTITYEVLKAKAKFTLELLPLGSCKDFHTEAHANDSLHHHYLFDDGVFRTMNYQGCPELFISIPGSTFTEHRDWYYNFEHAVEHERGLDFKEDLYTHGRFSVQLKKGDKLIVVISVDDPKGKDYAALIEKERSRRQALLSKFEGNEKIQRLALAADQFIVRRGELHSIIAGYPWFSDWGRDTMISLPGLCLTTGRFTEARDILLAFASCVSEGMLPNRFPDHGDVPEYNTIDATLWFFVAIHKYLVASNDQKFAQEILPVLRDIVEWHYRGTRYNIKVDLSDGLLAGGEQGVQLTWMDAKVGDWVVTPRRGKVVEINALWYNALKILARLTADAGDDIYSSDLETRAQQVEESFNNIFWNDMRGCLFDFVDGEEKNADLRPNQIFAISLPYQLLNKQRAQKVLKVVTDQLLTPKGLRSLERSHPDYHHIYTGDIWSRDGAYHQGTVWNYLIGPYVDALFFVKGDKAKNEASKIMKDFLLSLDEKCVGSISEICDGEDPFVARGCFAQAWSIAEALRVSVDYSLTGK